MAVTPDKQFIAAAAYSTIKLYELNSMNLSPVKFNFKYQVMSYEGHVGNVTAVGFQKDCKWLYSGSEDGTVKIWDMRAPGYQRMYETNTVVNTVVIHPNQVI